MDNSELNEIELDTSEMAPDLPVIDEKEHLLAKARIMGISVSNNMKVETLRERIREKLEGTAPVEAAPETNALSGETSENPKMTLRQKLQKEELRLVRVRVTNMDPKKKELQGEIFTVANDYIGTVRKFVPYGDATEDGYHIPYCIYRMMEERRFLNIRTIKDRRTGTNRIETQWAREFALEILPPLTQEELKRLANAQAAAGSVDSVSAE